MSTLTWTVVNFETDNTVEAVPTTWIHEDQCIWPPYTREKLQKAIQNGEVNTHWPSHKVTIFRDATFGDYPTARAKAQKAELTSDLNSENDCNKKRQKPKILSSSDSEDDMLLPQYRKKLPTPPKKKPRLSSQHLDVSMENNKSKQRQKQKILSSSDSEDEMHLPQYRKRLPTPPKKKPQLSSQHLDVSMENNKSQNSQFRADSFASTSTSTCNNSCTNCCRKNKEEKKTLFVIKNICCDILSKVDNLQNITSKPDSSAIPENQNLLNQVGVEYPMTTTQELSTFEEFFKNDEKFIALVRLFSKIGGSTTGDYIRRCLAPLLSNHLAIKYSFIGRKGKENFSILSLSKAIVEAADKMGFIKDKKETESAIGSWLKRGKARLELTEKKLIGPNI